jgi:hypothetical protein
MALFEISISNSKYDFFRPQNINFEKSALIFLTVDSKKATKTLIEKLANIKVIF